jgi:hypothetical protein
MSLRKSFTNLAILLSLALAASATAQVDHRQKDPNLPPLSAMNNGPLFWSYGDGSVPSVSFKNPPSEGLYLGFNENGSLIINQGNVKVYYWKLTDPRTLAGTLTVAFKSYQDVPSDTLAALQNPNHVVAETLAMRGKAPQPATIPQPPPPPPNPDKSGGLFGNNPRNSLQGLAPAAGTPADITGKNASVQGGILIFTMADGSKSKPYTVVRPTFMANAPQTQGIAGTWVAMESSGKGMMFNVQADNSVTGKQISPQVVQMLMQAAPKPR